MRTLSRWLTYSYCVGLLATGCAGVLPNVAYRTPTGGHVLLVLNDQPTPQTFGLRYQGWAVAATLLAGAVGTYVW